MKTKLKTLASSALEGVPGNVENRENTNIFSPTYRFFNLRAFHPVLEF